MRRWTILLAVLAIVGFAAAASAQGKIRLAQSSVTTTCMMTCNSQYANCQSSCVATSAPPTTNLGITTNPVQTCISVCTNQQLSCQMNCSRASPSK